MTETSFARNISWKILAAALTALALAACDPTEPDSPSIDEETFTVAAQTECFTHTRAGIMANSTRYDVVWERGDRIFAYLPKIEGGSPYTVGNFAIKDGFRTTSATLDVTDPIDPGALIWAPASLGSSPDALCWPEVQTYSDECGASGIPMCCTNVDTKANSQRLQFANLGGLLRLNLKGSSEFKLTGIELTSKVPMAGAFSIEGGAAILSDGAKCAVRLDVPSVSLDPGGMQFFISLAPGFYDVVEVKFTFADHDPIARNLSKSLLIKRAEITTETITMPDATKYHSGRLIRVDNEKNVDASAILTKVGELIGIQQVLVDLLFSPYISNPIHVARIIYYTSDPDGALVEASGVIAYQYSRSGALNYDRIVSFQHGTCNIADAPSYDPVLATELLPVCVTDPLSSKRYVAVMADYLGYGASQTPDLQHPYMHTGLTGSACADMISAAEEYLASRKISIPGGKLDLVGYSQGGAATLQTLIELERRGIDNDRINQVWAGAGPYDLLGFIDYFKGNENFDKSGFVPFTFRGICYGENMTLPNSSIYNEKLLSRVDVDQIFSTLQLDEWHEILGTSMPDILHPDFYREDFGGNADILRLVAAVRANSVISKPQPLNISKIRIYHSDTDDTVPFACSQSLQEVWPELAPVNVLKAKGDHVKGGIEFLLDYCGLGFLSYIL